jgi:hypothetical protein
MNESSNSADEKTHGQGYEGHTPNRDDQRDTDTPDLVLDIPVLNVDELDLEVDDLRAHVSLNAEILDFVKINVGVDVYLDNVKLGIKGVEAQALLKVKLERALGTLNRALEVIGNNPQVLSRGAQGTGQAAGDTSRGASQTARETGQDEDRAPQLAEGVAGQVDEPVEQSSDTMDHTVQRDVDESGNILETTLNESGEVINERITGHVDDQGQLVAQEQDESGNTVEEIFDEEGNILELDVSEGVNDGKAEDIGKVNATKAAERKARELGVRLSDVRGTGSGGRILVGDVEKAARG